ncbi:RUN and FYVE domain-containing protein 4 [Penaeus vannamei]|uniref:RUN and FYVE domain-containing protein 4 n=1 Tax=Penaeus vannamei TaxID=6689 RepID=A0A3R7PRB2_PENVA|nr:RUN and FYVE domain-containing protein 4 [Penaeus vannamei]
MSISDPLIKELKGHVLEATKASSNGAILDIHPFLLPLCQVLESIFRKGLNNIVHSAFGITRRDYWAWIDKTAQTSAGLQGNFKRIVEEVSSNPSINTPQGRGRLFIRHALKSKCLHVPVETIVRMKCNEGIYEEDSIIGDEILGEIFLSLLYQCSHLHFDLKLENASFLDETWQLPQYQEYELVPCMDLGVYLGHVSGRAVVVKVEDGSVAAEDNKIEVGDVIDEAFGICINGWRRGRVTALLRQKRGLPVTLKVIKGHYPNGSVFPGVIPLLRRLHLDVDSLQERFREAALSESQETSLTGSHIGYVLPSPYAMDFLLSRTIMSSRSPLAMSLPPF